MKKTITIVIIVLVVLGLGFYLFKISPQQSQTQSVGNFQLDTSGAKPLTAPLPFDPASDHYLGSPQAKNVLIEYADMQCPACAAYSDMLKQVPGTFKDTVFVFRYFPLVQIHQNAVESALAAEAAGAQGKYWEMHDILFAKQSDWESLSDPLDAFAQYAQSAGVANLDQFKSDITSKKYLSKIEQDNNEALGLNLPGTPTFFFNGHVLQNQDLAGLEKQAEQYYQQ
ncbi:MAG TPA: thioredoxin domain-containing protein [Patescibacteria group bacterium]|nr:thioredoxin domain-containing protein [Patescibacteria group bacterium]